MAPGSDHDNDSWVTRITDLLADLQRSIDDVATDIVVRVTRRSDRSSRQHSPSHTEGASLARTDAM